MAAAIDVKALKESIVAKFHERVEFHPHALPKIDGFKDVTQIDDAEWESHDYAGHFDTYYGSSSCPHVELCIIGLNTDVGPDCILSEKDGYEIIHGFWPDIKKLTFRQGVKHFQLKREFEGECGYRYMVDDCIIEFGGDYGYHAFCGLEIKTYESDFGTLCIVDASEVNIVWKPSFVVDTESERHVWHSNCDARGMVTWCGQRIFDYVQFVCAKYGLTIPIEDSNMLFWSVYISTNSYDNQFLDDVDREDRFDRSAFDERSKEIDAIIDLVVLEPAEDVAINKEEIEHIRKIEAGKDVTITIDEYLLNLKKRSVFAEIVMKYSVEIKTPYQPEIAEVWNQMRECFMEHRSHA
jgi:hypothetical protein